MPKTPINYQNTHFYKIVCKDINISDCYVGHTTNFKTRRQQHRRTCYNENDKIHYDIYLYQFMRENGGFDNFDMILLKTESCENALHARRREREYIEELKATLNKSMPIRTDDERNVYRRSYYQDNKKVIQQKAKDYRKENAETINEQRKKLREVNRECINQLRREWRDKHKETINEKRRQYREQNRDKINEQKRLNHHKHKDKNNQKSREYYKEHKEVMNQQSREYRQNHLEERRQKDRDYHWLHKEERNKKSKEYYERKKLQSLENQASEEHTEEFLQTTQDS